MVPKRVKRRRSRSLARGAPARISAVPAACVARTSKPHCADFAERFSAALARRAQLSAGLDVLRLFDGEGDGLEGVCIDRYGPAMVVHLYPELLSPASRQQVRSVLSDYASTQKLAATYAKTHTSAGRAQAELWYGAAQGRFPVQERELKFLVQPDAQLNAGLFIDMRSLRERLHGVAGGLRVLNTFCFTGSLGIAAASGGAAEVVQADASQSALNWARANHELNPSAAALRFVCEDTSSFLEREVRRLQRGAQPYDLVLLDPPAFGRAGAKRFSLRQDAPRILSLAMQLLSTGGNLLFSANISTLTHAHLQRFVDLAADLSGRRVLAKENLLPCSIDFPSRMQNSHAMRGLWLRIA